MNSILINPKSQKSNNVYDSEHWEIRESKPQINDSEKLERNLTCGFGAYAPKSVPMTVLENGQD
jgi:hypothetical protein